MRGDMGKFIACFLACVGYLGAEAIHRDVVLNIRLNCPPSEELEAFLAAVPQQETANLEEWRTGFVHSMGKLLQLVESKNVNKASWKVHTGTQYSAKEKKAKLGLGQDH